MLGRDGILPQMFVLPVTVGSRTKHALALSSVHGNAIALGHINTVMLI